MKKIYIVLLLIFFIIALITGGFFIFKYLYKSESNFKSSNYNNLEDYYANIDHSCNMDSDCEVKDIHNCCGYYPECVNKNTKIDPSVVREICARESLGSSCGFPSIIGCKCIKNKCERY